MFIHTKIIAISVRNKIKNERSFQVKNTKSRSYQGFYGASDEIRTRDLVLTKDARCRLRHGSILHIYNPINPYKGYLCELNYKSKYQFYNFLI